MQQTFLWYQSKSKLSGLLTRTTKDTNKVSIDECSVMTFENSELQRSLRLTDWFQLLREKLFKLRKKLSEVCQNKSTTLTHRLQMSVAVITGAGQGIGRPGLSIRIFSKSRITLGAAA
jgi:hypothetical protein